MLSFIHRIEDAFNISDRRTVVIEGGLGSQILSSISFWNLQKEIGFQNAKCNLSYFQNANDSSLRPWCLDSYGIKLKDFDKYSTNSRLRILLQKKDWIDEQDLKMGYWKKARDSFINKFDFDETLIANFYHGVSKTTLPKSFGAIHIRRGDYVQMASKLIEDEEYYDLLSNLVNIFPNFILIISDSPLTKVQKSKLKRIVGSQKIIRFMDDASYDSFAVHCLLRMADVLITANSTYSFSAALLGKSGQKVLSPLDFHAGQKSHRYNEMFRAPAGFAVWRSFD